MVTKLVVKGFNVQPVLCRVTITDDGDVDNVEDVQIQGMFVPEKQWRAFADEGGDLDKELSKLKTQ